MPNEKVEIQPIAGAPKPSDMTDFEREQLRVERLKAWLTAGSIIASVAAAILAYFSAERVHSQQAAEAFQLKAAEIVMASKTPWEAQGKARAWPFSSQTRFPPA